jgi:hypothetical protein
MAFNPLTGQAEWKVPVTETVISAGMLATDGGLLFTGREASSSLSIKPPARRCGNSKPAPASILRP